VDQILIVEDEHEMAELLSQILTESGYKCVRASTGAEGLAKASKADLILADVMMPIMSGFDMVTQLRAQGSRVPIIFLTAKDGTKDLVHGLEMGGDDYLVKPFKLEELLARIKTNLRRARDTSNLLKWNDFTLDCSKRTAFRGETELFLSPTQFSLLEAFLRRPDVVVSKNQLLEWVWADDGYRRENIVETYVNYVRTKTEIRGAPRVIHTVRRKGYVLSDVEPNT
jgi:DNA-binding response OmpR family regulator